MATATESSILDKMAGLKEILQRKYRKLTDKLQVKKVIPYLIEEGILTIEDKQEIMAPETSRDRAQALVDKVISHGDCTLRQFVDVLRRSDHGHLADMLVGGPNSKAAQTEGTEEMTFVQLTELESRLKKVYREEAERYEGNTSLEGLMGYEIDHANSGISVAKMENPVYLPSGWSVWRGLERRPRPLPTFLVVEDEAGRQVGTALVADWAGNKTVTSDFEQVIKLKVDDVRKDQTIKDAIFDQLLWRRDYKPSFSKEALWRFIEQNQEEILFILEGVEHLSPFISQEILQLINKKLLPRAAVIVTNSGRNKRGLETSDININGERG